MKTYACHLCEAEWNAGELPVRSDGSYDCPGCGYTFYAVARTTRFIENSPYDAHYWECEQCKSAWWWEQHPREGKINYCPVCGRKIAELVDYVDTWEDEAVDEELQSQCKYKSDGTEVVSYEKIIPGANAKY